MRKILLVLIAAASMLGCEWFDEVVVPEVDTTPPTAWSGLWMNNEYVKVTYGSNPGFEYEITDPTQVFGVFSAGTDNGGIAHVEMYPEYRYKCHQGNITQYKWATLVPITTSQTGAPGDTVSNGLYTGGFVQFSNLPNLCNPGWDWQEIEVRFLTYVEDLHGNSDSHGYVFISHTW